MKNKAKIKFSPLFEKYLVKFCTVLDNGLEIENARIHFETEKGDTIEEIKSGLFRAGFVENDIEVEN